MFIPLMSLLPVFVCSLSLFVVVLEQFKLGVPSSTDLAIIELEMIKITLK